MTGAPAYRAIICLCCFVGSQVTHLCSPYKHTHTHISVSPLKMLAVFVCATHVAGGLLAVEPFTASVRLLSVPELRDLAGCCTLFSPNLEEGASMLGLRGELDIVRRLLGGWAPTGPGARTRLQSLAWV